MIISRATIRFMSPFLLASFAALTCYVPMTQAAMIATEQTLHAMQPGADRAHVEALLARADVAEQLQAAGVDPQQLQSRLSSLTDEEIAAINGQLDELPAGGDILGTAVFVFLVLLATDILGFTDIFPFVKKTVK
jgi:hypothetical protein